MIEDRSSRSTAALRFNRSTLSFILARVAGEERGGGWIDWNDENHWNQPRDEASP